MRKNRIIPIILINNNRVVKGVNFNNHIYIGDPINTVKLFNDKKADEIIILNISKKIDFSKKFLTQLKNIFQESSVPITYGGGIKNIKQIKKLIHIGCEKISINNSAITNPKLITEASKILGSQSVVVSIDVKKIGEQFIIHRKNGTIKTNLDLIEYIKIIQNYGAGEILITSIDNEGLMKGYNIEMLKKIKSFVKIPIILNGGAGSSDHFKNTLKYDQNLNFACSSFFIFTTKKKGILINYPFSKKNYK